jgi:hypothetical protein
MTRLQVALQTAGTQTIAFAVAGREIKLAADTVHESYAIDRRCGLAIPGGRIPIAE